MQGERRREVHEHPVVRLLEQRPVERGAAACGAGGRSYSGADAEPPDQR